MKRPTQAKAVQVIGKLVEDAARGDHNHVRPHKCAALQPAAAEFIFRSNQTPLKYCKRDS